MKKIGIAFFALFTVIGFYLRWHEIAKQPLWFDELFSVIHSSEPSSILALFEGIRRDVHPPGYQLILFYWIKLFGNSEFSVRSLSAISNTISIVWIGMIFYRKYSSDLLRTFALTATLSANFMLLVFSQEARSYALLASSGTVLLLLSVIRTRPEEKEIPGSALILLLISFVSYLHYIGLLWSLSIVGVSVFLAAFQKNWKELRFWILAGLTPIILILPWAVYNLGGREWKPMGHIPPATLSYFFFLPLYFYSWALIIILPFFLGCIARGLKNRKENLEFLFSIGAMFLFLFGLIFLQEFVNVPLINFRNLIPLSSGILLSFFLINQSSDSRWIRFYYSVISIIVLFQIGSYVKTYKKVQRQDYRKGASIALQWKRELSGKDKKEPKLVTAYPDLFSYYLSPETAEICGEEKEYGSVESIPSGSVIIYLAPTLSPLEGWKLRKCLFADFVSERKDGSAFQIEITQFRKK
ncbi:hypothetical protein EHQ27_18535 [Leptospira wolffii]|uniref:hypothetical protein n=1 Tax=Leptospira wolffii TaxID=409998 RepID=UPI0010834020|nr:hypothetical protein [Leptospira wolffii]TGK55266.1 hypothetical protein EHQ32_18760 [Leptospira wolffii]TGK65775.1 hypothetical protein EHQ27_18535 [Leptospira wolffii]TGK70433.1 hypothetical protein EHQ35_15750 [Leptospira wolffii]TGL30031.1 hypothetical protein EHQ57_09890 [Leptospira wolffii]